MTTSAECELCATDGGVLLWRDADCRVVLVGGDEGRQFPGFCRVVWNRHVAEMSDLPPPRAARLMRAVLAVERVLRAQLAPDKINLASLGNVVPHLHWHVIPRWRDDCRFPRPIWAAQMREEVGRAPVDIARLAAALSAELSAELAAALVTDSLTAPAEDTHR